MDINIDKLYADHVEILFAKAKIFLESQHLDALMLGSGSEIFIDRDDQPYPWKMPAFLRHFIYEDIGPDAVLLITKNSIEVYIYQSIDFWYAPAKTHTGVWTKHIKVHSYHDIDLLHKDIIAHLPNRVIYYTPPNSKLSFADTAKNATDEQIRLIQEWRVHKSEFEITCIKEANLNAVMGHVAAKESFEEGVSEFDIHLDYLSMTKHAEQNLPYPNIVALNEHAAILHYQHLDQNIPDDKHSFLIDAGANYNGYAADITRTHAGINASDAFMSLLYGMRQIKLSVIEKCLKDSAWVDIQEYTHVLISELLIGLNILHNIDAENAYNQGLTKIFYPHGIGHLLGIQVHDVGGFQNTEAQILAPSKTHPFLRMMRNLEFGMVVTIEPGVYFIHSLLEKAFADPQINPYLNKELIHELMPYGGVRDEDNIVITHAKPRNLTAEAFAEIGHEYF